MIFLFKFLRDGLSLDETRVSILIMIFIVSSIFGLIMYYINGDITNNLLQIILTLIYAIAGVNLSNTVSNVLIDVFNKKNNKEKEV